MSCRSGGVETLLQGGPQRWGKGKREVVVGEWRLTLETAVG